MRLAVVLGEYQIYRLANIFAYTEIPLFLTNLGKPIIKLFRGSFIPKL